MRTPEPVIVVALFPEERTALLELLSELTDEEWQKPTVCAGWSVKDVALHILGDDLGILSRKRDGFRHSAGAQSGDLVDLVNRINEDWVQATRRLSGCVLCELLGFTAGPSLAYFQSLDPTAIGEAVSWAGPDPAPIWLDIAREYTERWLHQQHIRDAIGRPGLNGRRFLGPVLETFVRALPRTFRDVGADAGIAVGLTITGESGGDWGVVRETDRWNLYKGTPVPPAAAVTIGQDAAWRVFTRGLSRREAVAASRIEGDRSLGIKVLETVSIIA